jgi:hypothetical protein
MAYNITLTNGNPLATIPDGEINNTASSVTLVGKNYAGYGQFLDENFVQMLENFANSTSPTPALIGQLWWDSNNFLLKVWNGTIWKTISAATASSTAPTSNVTGDLWYDITNAQLKVWNGTAFIVVGPAYSSATGLAGALPLSIDDVTGGTRTVTALYADNSLVAIVNPSTSFVPVATYSTAFPTIYTGITVSKSTSGQSGLLAGNVVNNGNITFSAGGTTNIAIVTSAGANVAGYVNATGNITGGNITTGGTATVTGNITGGNLAIGGLANVTGTITGGNIATGGSITATGNITSTANVAGGNVKSTGIVSATGTITGGNIATGGIITAGSTVSAAGNITSSANIAGANIIASTSVSSVGTIVAGTYFLGDGGLLSNVQFGASVTRVENGLSNVAIGTANANITMGVSNVGNVVVVSQTGIITSGSLTLNTGNTALTAVVNGAGNGVGNIGSSTGYFNRIFAVATSALYADVAERFESDELLDPGTVVELGGAKEITRSRVELSENVFGVISTRPAFTMNGGAGENDTHPAVAMTGRVPVNVTGIINKGDRLVSAGNGIARAAKPGEATAFNVIGRALVSKSTNDLGTVEAIVSIQI